MNKICKIVLILSICAVSLNSNSLYAEPYRYTLTTSTSKPWTFDELAAPIIAYGKLYDEAERNFDYYYEKAYSCLYDSSHTKYSLAAHYFDKCVKLNSRFHESFGNMGDLIALRGYSLYLSGNKAEGMKDLNNAKSKYNSSIADELLKVIRADN